MGGSRIDKWVRRWGVPLAGVIGIGIPASIGGYLYIDAERVGRSYEDQAKEKAAYYADRARLIIETTCLQLAPADQRNCVREQAQAARQSQHDEYDLQAQRETAAWTRAMGIAALIAMVFGMVGVGLVYLTFSAQRRGNRIAQREYARARLEARQAAKEAREARQEFVNLERGRLVVSLYEPLEYAGTIWAAMAEVSNIGKSSVGVIECRFDMLQGVEFPETFKGRSGSTIVLQQGDTKRFSVALFDSREVEKRCFLGGYVEYRSAFGSTHRAYFLTRIDRDDGPKPPVSGPDQFVFRSHPYTDAQSRKRFGWPEDT